MIVPAIFGVGNAGSLAVAVAFLILFGLGWGFFDCNNMPILSQIVRPELRATGYGIMNFVSISCGGLADWGFGVLRDRQVPLNVIFSVFASLAILSVVLVLLIKPRHELTQSNPDDLEPARHRCRPSTCIALGSAPNSAGEAGQDYGWNQGSF